MSGTEQLTPDALAQAVAEIRERLSKITPGKWRYEQIAESVFSEREGQYDIAVCDVGSDWMSDDDGFFIAHAPADVRLLLDALDAAEQRAERLQRERDAIHAEHLIAVATMQRLLNQPQGAVLPDVLEQIVRSYLMFHETDASAPTVADSTMELLPPDDADKRNER